MQEGCSRLSWLCHKLKIVKAYARSHKQLILSYNGDIMEGAITHVSAANVKRYGFVSNPNHLLWKNKKDELNAMDLSLFDRQPSNATFYNLIGKELPCGSEQLLDLSLKFCIQDKIPL
jgi:hypothetical protein